MTRSPQNQTGGADNNLRAWRLARGRTLEEVAARMGVSHSTVLRWESGEVDTRSGFLLRAAKRRLARPKPQS